MTCVTFSVQLGICAHIQITILSSLSLASVSYPTYTRFSPLSPDRSVPGSGIACLSVSGVTFLYVSVSDPLPSPTGVHGAGDGAE